MAKWETTHTQYGPPGRKYEHKDYPAAMYRPGRDPKGVLCFEFEVAESETRRSSLEALGYVYGGKGAALKVLEEREAEIAKLAANRAFNERTMSPKARAEAEAADDETDQHLPVIPEQPVTRRRGRPAKEK